MKVVTVSVALALIFLLGFSSVFAAGTSTVDDSSDEATSEEDDAAVATDACDSQTDRKERILCRLREAKEARLANRAALRERYASADYERDVLPEACRRLGEATQTTITSKTQCRELYNNLRECYSMSGREKPRCFKENAGLTGNRLSDAAPKYVRNYVVALLYDIQERVEHANEEGNVSDEDAAAIIDLIVEIKEDIMNGEGRGVVRPKIAELKTLLRAAAQASADSSDDTEEETSE